MQQSSLKTGSTQAAGKSITIKEEPVFSIKEGDQVHTVSDISLIKHKRIYLQEILSLKRINANFVVNSSTPMIEADNHAQHGIKNV